MRRTILATMLASCLAGAIPAAEPPDVVHYQGVLRDANDIPLNGDYDMVFRFYDSSGTTLHMTDSHASGDPFGPVTVTNGFFDVYLGLGTMTGLYGSMAELFAAADDVWMEVEIDGEIFDGLIPIVSAPYALNALTLSGRPAYEFLNTSSAPQTKTGTLLIDAASGYGVEARGPAGGGYFEDNNHTGYAWAAVGNAGVEGYGTGAGGLFGDYDNTGFVYAGYENYGIRAFGSAMGGYFQTTADTARARVAWGFTGIHAEGDQVGGYFENSYGVGAVWAGLDNIGIQAVGNPAGEFWDYSSTSRAFVADGHRGIWGKGLFAGATFSHMDNLTYWADVSQEIGDPPTTYKIRGTGQASFVQNHPEDPNRVIVYSAPEGDEAAVYTRGTARLVGGEARVALGETFRWVTNPDIGLTAHVTPRGSWGDLYVASVTPEEIVVRASEGAPDGLVFDYLVFGLRIGFEHSPVVQPKDREALLPAHDVGEEFYSLTPSPDSRTALARFSRMATETLGTTRDDAGLGGATALRESIRASAWQMLGKATPEDAPRSPGRPVRPAPDERIDETRPAGPAEHSSTKASVHAVTHDAEPEVEVPAPMTEDHRERFPVSEEVETGDLLALDPERPGTLRRAETEADPGVVGVVAEEPITLDGTLQAPLVDSLFATVKTDASYAAVRPGDLLTSSPTPGHAMRAVAPVPGTVIGRALEPLESGTGLIKIQLTRR